MSIDNSTDATASTALSTEVNIPSPIFLSNVWIDCAVVVGDLISCLTCGRPMTIQERRRALFLATDRSCANGGSSTCSSPEFCFTDSSNSNKTLTYDYDRHHEVLELVLARNHCLGGLISKKHAVVVETPDRQELVPKREQLPKNSLQKLQEIILDLFNLFSLNAKPNLDEENDRWVKVDPQIYELILNSCGPIQSERVSNDISVFVRRATRDEIIPYHVEFHLSQKQVHERAIIWMSQSANICRIGAQQAATSTMPRCTAMPRCTEIVRCEFDLDEKMITSVDSNDSFVMSSDVPDQISVAAPPSPKMSHANRGGTHHHSNIINKISHGPHLAGGRVSSNIWIPDFDVVLGVDGNKADVTTTTATRIFQQQILPIYASKANLREGHINVMKLMLKEELMDEGKIQGQNLPTFWMKVGDLEEETRTVGKHRGDSTKWLHLENGDFLGPFIAANCHAIQKALADLIKDDPRDSLLGCATPRDPEPSWNGEESAPTDEQDPTNEQDPIIECRQAIPEVPAPTTVTLYGQPPLLFNMEGPLTQLSDEAKRICQHWIDSSETMLIKAAKKILIDSFQADFNSFLFLFQVQLKRIKGGDLSKRDGFSVVSADDTSWVSAEPSVEEEDTRVADIERACVAFMNQMGNDMVKQYERLSGSASSNNSVVGCTSVLSVAAAGRQDDHHTEAARLTAVSSSLTTVAVRGASHQAPTAEIRHDSPTSVEESKEDMIQTGKNRYSFYPRGHAVMRDLAAKEVSFDVHESVNKIQNAVRKAVERLDAQDMQDCPSKQSRNAESASKYRTSKYDEHDETEDSTRSEDPTFDTSFDDPSFEPSYASASYEASYEARDDGDYDTVGSRTRSYDEDEDDDETYPTVDTAQLDSATLSAYSETFDDEIQETAEKKSSWAGSWVPVWL